MDKYALAFLSLVEQCCTITHVKYHSYGVRSYVVGTSSNSRFNQFKGVTSKAVVLLLAGDFLHIIGIYGLSNTLYISSKQTNFI